MWLKPLISLVAVDRPATWKTFKTRVVDSSTGDVTSLSSGTEVGEVRLTAKENTSQIAAKRGKNPRLKKQEIQYQGN